MTNRWQRAVLGATRVPAMNKLTEATDSIQKLLADVLPGQAMKLPAGLMRSKSAPASHREPPPGTPGGPAAIGRFVPLTYRDSAGEHRYKLFIPDQMPAAPPLVVMLHGCTQSPDDFAAGTRMNELAGRQGCLVAYPEQTSSANAQRCWNWFRTGDQQRGVGEPALVAGIAGEVMREYGVDPRRVYVAGLSAGGAAAAVLAEAYPDLFAAVGVHSGLACGAAHDMASAFMAMHAGHVGSAGGVGKRPNVPVVVFHGDRDNTVNPANADSVIAQRTGDGSLQTETDSGSVPGGRSWTRTRYRDPKQRVVVERWLVHGEGHAWSGGSSDGSYTDPQGPDASGEMLRFFLEHPKAG